MTVLSVFHSVIVRLWDSGLIAALMIIACLSLLWFWVDAGPEAARCWFAPVPEGAAP